MKEIIISRQEEGQRLSRYLEKYLPKAGRGFLYKMLRKKNITLNGARASGSEVLAEKDRICIYFSEDTLAAFRGKEKDLSSAGHAAYMPDRKKTKTAGSRICVLYEDEDILIIHKPAGILSQKAERGDSSLNDWLLDYSGYGRGDGWGFRPSIANRLDRNTSGIVLAGLSIAGLQALSFLLQKRTVEKLYLCPVAGRMEGRGRLKGYHKKDGKTNRVRLYTDPVPGASPVESRYRVLAGSDRASLVELDLVTGKSHQIRAQLSAAGHPILGDYKYGNRKVNEKLKKELAVDRQLLHAWRFRVPRSLPDRGESLSIPAGKVLDRLEGMDILDPPPEEFTRVLDYYNLTLSEDIC